MQNHSLLKYLPLLGLLPAMVLWASSFVALKIAFRVYHPMVLIFGRMAVARPASASCSLLNGSGIQCHIRLDVA